jgi:hypothetical protein
MFDNIDFNERERDGDAVILDLFHQWQVALIYANEHELAKEATLDDELRRPRLDTLFEIEDRLAGTPASGMVGLAIKGCIVAHEEGGLLGCFLTGIIKDAARFVPELGPLVEKLLEADLAARAEDEQQAPLDIAALRERVAAIVAEFDLPLPDGDAGIFEADRRSRAISERFRALDREFEIDVEIEQEINPERERLADPLLDYLEQGAEPRTLAAAAVMLRHAFDGGVAIRPDGGMLGNVLALIEREAAAKGGAA